MSAQSDSLFFGRKNACKLLYLQSAIILLVAFTWTIFRGLPSTWSALLGGIAWLLPSFYFIRKLFIMSKAHGQQNLVMRFYIGELVKLLFSALLVILFIKLLPVVLLPFLSGYIGAVMTAWFMPYAYRNV